MSGLVDIIFNKPKRPDFEKQEARADRAEKRELDRQQSINEAESQRRRASRAGRSGRALLLTGAETGVQQTPAAAPATKSTLGG